MRTERRRLVEAAAAILGYSAQDTAARLGCSCNHLTLVLDGVRTPSARLAAEILDLIHDAKPLLIAAFENASLA